MVFSESLKAFSRMNGNSVILISIKSEAAPATVIELNFDPFH